MKKIISLISALCISLSLCVPAAHAEGADVTIYVSINDGDDSGAGTKEAPFKTVERGIDEIKKRAGAKKELILRGGTYYFKDGITLQSLGSENESITIKGYDGEVAKLTSAQNLAVENITKVTDNQILEKIPEEARNNIYSIDLRALGITNYGTIETKLDGTIKVNRTADFYWNDRPMDLSRWPNDDYAEIEAVKSADQQNQTMVFTTEEDRINRWTTAKDPYVYGFFHYGWSDSAMPVTEFNTQDMSITTKGYCKISPNRRFYVFNMLEEIDAEREYYIDRDRGIMYFYTTEDVKTADFQFAINNTKSIVNLAGCQNITLENLHIGGGTKGAIGMGESCRNIDIKFCQIFCVADCGIEYGYNTSATIGGHVYGCEIRNIGKAGIRIYSGDIKSLTYGNIIIENNHMYSFGEKDKTYEPAVYLAGVGNQVIHNVIHDAPHEGIHFGGNENIIAYNEMYDLMNETDDCGAIYGGRNFLSRNFINNNFFHDFGKYGQAIMGIYCDDLLSGTDIKNNVFINCPSAASIGGGRYSTISNNLVMDKAQNGSGGISIDQRGTAGFTTEYFIPGDLNSPMLKNVVDTMSNKSNWEKWIEKYPHLENILEDDPGVPKYNTVTGNVSANAGPISVTDLNIEHGTFENNHEIGPVAYEITEDRQLHIIETEKLEACEGFSIEALELDKIGVYGDGNYTIPKAEYVRTTGKEIEAAKAPSENIMMEASEIFDIGDSLVSEKKNWDDSAADITVSGGEATVGNGIIGHKTKKSKNILARTTFKMSAETEWIGIQVRSNVTNEVPWAGHSCYLLIMKPNQLELQRWNGGSHMLDQRDNYYYLPNEWNNLELRAYTAEDGKVWVSGFINGTRVFNVEDNSELLRWDEEGTVNILVTGGTATFKPYDEEYNRAVDIYEDDKENTTKTDEAPTVIKKPITVFYNDKQLKTDAEPYIKNGRTMAPFRIIFETFGAMVDFDDETKKVSATKDNKRILLDIPNEKAYINGVLQKVDAPAEIVSDTTMVPLRLIAETLGARVEWNQAEYRVDIYSADYVAPDNTDDKEEDKKEEQKPETNYTETREFDEAKLTKHNIQIVEPGANIEGGLIDQKGIDKLIKLNVEEEAYYIRNGLPNFRYKLEETNEKLNVVFLGGSITQGDGYRNHICNWLEENFGKRFNFYNEGIGGTGSGLANTRYYYDVITKKPDLVFVEFAVNDGTTGSGEGIEAILRQQWTHDPTVDVMLLYTVQESGLNTAQEGKWTPVAKAQDFVANHYSIPSVFMGHDAVQMARNGEILWKGDRFDNSIKVPIFSEDGVHPSTEGSKIYWETAKPAFEKMLLGDKIEGEMWSEPVAYLAKSNAYVIQHADMQKVINEAFSALPAGDYPNWKNRTDNVYHATEIGDRITFEFSGTEAGIFVLSGGDCPALDVIVDGKEVYKGLNIFLPYHGVVGYGLTTVSTGTLENGNHTVTIKISQDKVDKADQIRRTSNNQAQLALLEEKADFYNSTNFIIGSVFVKGEMK